MVLINSFENYLFYFTKTYFKIIKRIGNNKNNMQFQILVLFMED